MMRIFLTIASILALAAMPLQAAQSRTYADALKKAGKDKPVVVFCYGANFDEVGRKAYETFFRGRDKTMLKALSREIYVVIPVYQLPTEQEKREQEKALGGHAMPGGIWSLPCFLVMDGQGNYRGSVRSSDELATPETAAKALTVLLENFDKQQKALERSEKASGSQKEKLMREALNVPGLQTPRHTLFDPSQNGVVEKLQIMDLETANAYIRHLLANGSFTPIERQMIMAAYAGHVRRSKGPIPRLRAIYTEMRNIAPDTIYGAYAEGAIELWVEPHEQEPGGEKKEDEPAAE